MINVEMALAGGVLIGLAASVMLIFNGRVTGISGILNGFMGQATDGGWRGMFLLGLLLGGVLLGSLHPSLFENVSGRSEAMVIFSGLLVGFGTTLGSGCTSGHGVCGLSRFSVRSLVATVIFMLFGVFAATGFHYLVGA